MFLDNGVFVGTFGKGAGIQGVEPHVDGTRWFQGHRLQMICRNGSVWTCRSTAIGQIRILDEGGANPQIAVAVFCGTVCKRFTVMTLCMNVG
jgi:hypothetical protein